MHYYSIESGKLAVRNEKQDPVFTLVDFGNASVYKILPLPDRDGCLVLLDPGSSRVPTFENLLLVNSDGAVVWKAQLSKPHDAFVDVLLSDRRIEAMTWCGYRLEVDTVTGHSREIGFGK
jgi:hypothetical protein